MFLNLGRKERRIKFSFNSICAMEEISKQSIMTLLNEQAGFNSIRLLVWAGLRHENRGLTLDMVGLWIEEYLDEGNDFGEFFESVVNALVESGVLGNKEAENETKKTKKKQIS